MQLAPVRVSNWPSSTCSQGGLAWHVAFEKETTLHVSIRINKEFRLDLGCIRVPGLSPLVHGFSVLGQPQQGFTYHLQSNTWASPTLGCYLGELITIKQKGRYSLRSRSSLALNYCAIKSLATLADRSFSVAVPRLWNAIPDIVA